MLSTFVMSQYFWKKKKKKLSSEMLQLSILLCIAKKLIFAFDHFVLNCFHLVNSFNCGPAWGSSIICGLQSGILRVCLSLRLESWDVKNLMTFCGWPGHSSV